MGCAVLCCAVPCCASLRWLLGGLCCAGQATREVQQHPAPAGLHRHTALLAAASSAEGAQVAVLDATNSTEERRNFLRTRFHGQRDMNTWMAS